MLSQQQTLEYYRIQTNKQKVYDALKDSETQIKILEAALHRDSISSPCVLRQLMVAMSIVAGLPDKNFMFEAQNEQC